MKKVLLYSLVAMVLGLSLMLVPLITVSNVKAISYFPMPEQLSKELQGIEGMNKEGIEDTYRQKLEMIYSQNTEVEIFAISFVIALVVYLLVKSVIPRRDYERFGPYWY